MRIVQRMTSGGMLLLLALVVGGATTAGSVTWLHVQSTPAPATSAVEVAKETTEVVVARDALAAGTRLATPMLRVVAVPAELVPERALTSLADAAGQLTRYPLEAGEPLLASRLIGPETGGVGLAYAIPAGMRAVSVPFSEVMGAGGLLVPGDHVDVLVHTRYGRLFAPGEAALASAGEDAPVVITALQDVTVLAVGQEYARSLPLADERSARSDNVEAQPAARSITLAVTPEQAQRLFMAVREGELGLALRSFGDESSPALTPLLRFETTSLPGVDLAVARGNGS